MLSQKNDFLTQEELAYVNTQLDEATVNHAFSNLSPNGPYGMYKSWTPLMIASCNGHVEIVKHCLQFHSIGVNLKNKDGNTALHLAILENNIKIIALLLEHKADVLIQNNNGRTPLHWVSLKLKSSILNHEFLLAKMSNNTMALKEVLAQKQAYRSLVELLLNNNADYWQKDQWNTTPLQYLENNIYSKEELYSLVKSKEFQKLDPLLKCYYCMDKIQNSIEEKSMPKELVKMIVDFISLD
jgi:hypothetical protein